MDYKQKNLNLKYIFIILLFSFSIRFCYLFIFEGLNTEFIEDSKDYYEISKYF